MAAKESIEQQDVKTCPKCGENMPLNRKTYYCTDCKHLADQKHYKKNKTNIIQRTIAYAKTEHGQKIKKKSREKYNISAKGRSAQKRYNATGSTQKCKKRYAKSTNGRASARRSAQRYRNTINGKLKTQVRRITLALLKKMDLSEQRCQICNGEYEQFHHFTYDINDPLNGIFACVSCHKVLHKEEG